MVDADEARERGLVNAVHEPDELVDAALDLAAVMSQKSPLAMAYAKESVGLALHADYKESLETEGRLFSMIFASADQAEGMSAFIEKRDPKFIGR